MVLLIAVLSVNMVLAYRNIRELHRDTARVIHTHEVLDALNGVLSLVTDAETGQRGYVISGENPYLEPYRDSMSALYSHVEKLNKLISDNPIQLRCFGEMKALLEKRLQILERILNLRKEKSLEAAQKEFVKGEGRMVMKVLRQKVFEMQRHERNLLEKRLQRAKTVYEGAIFTSIFSGILGFTLLCMMFYLLRRYLLSRDRAAAIIYEQREQFRITIASIGDAVITTDEQGRILYLNQIAQNLTGWSLEESVGQPMEKIFHIVNESSRKPVENPAERALREGVVVGLANHTILISKDGTERPIDDSAAPIRNKNGKIIGVILVFHDVTERKKIEKALFDKAEELNQLNQKLRRLDETKTNFISIASHELKTPLTVIRGYLELYLEQEGAKLSAEHKEYLDIVQKGVSQLQRLINALLDISKIESGQIPIQFKECVDLKQIAQECCRGFLPQSQKKQISIDCQVSGAPALVRGDEDRIREVLENLLSNSLKYTHRGGSVQVRFQELPNSVEVSVEDTGIGISEEDQKKIFEPFQHLCQSGLEGEESTGLGLMLVKKIVEAHRGWIHVKSTVGKGSVFTVCFPRFQSEK